MASPATKTKKQVQGAAKQRSVKIQQYVNRQLEKTRRRVKTVDLFAAVLGLMAVALGVLLVLVAVDAWVWTLSTAGRWISLSLLVVAIAAYSFFYILPLVLRRINPQYAAKMIEESEPGFKNRLLNYLSLRDSKQKMPGAVTDIVARQAAEKLNAVPEEATVDRSNLIRAGFLLVGIATLAVLYTILSPKSPFPTIGRIFSPASKISQPSIVQISDVLPGDCNVFFGEPLEISAKVSGSHDPNDVKILYSTEDGRLVDQILPMNGDGTSNGYHASLTTDGTGIQQALTYRIVARDGTTPEFNVLVRPNPTISIQSIEIDPPNYTELPERVVDGQGDVQVIEGTEVTINALANMEIKSAHVDLLALKQSDDSKKPDAPVNSDWL